MEEEEEKRKKVKATPNKIQESSKLKNLNKKKLVNCSFAVHNL